MTSSLGLLSLAKHLYLATLVGYFEMILKDSMWFVEHFPSIMHLLSGCSSSAITNMCTANLNLHPESRIPRSIMSANNLAPNKPCILSRQKIAAGK